MPGEGQKGGLSWPAGKCTNTSRRGRACHPKACRSSPPRKPPRLWKGDGTMADLCVLIERMRYGGNYAGMYGELFDRLQIAICDQNPYR